MNRYPAEGGRFAFIAKRDGLDAVYAFAYRTMVAYRRRVLKTNGLLVRRGFIESYLDFKRVIFDMRESKDVVAMNLAFICSKAA